MENTYRLSYTAEDIDRRLGNMDNVLMTTEQELTQEQQLQVQANLGITSSPSIVGIHIDPSSQIDIEYLTTYFNAYYYSNLTDAVTDINEENTINAKVKPDDTTGIAVYTDINNNTCLVLLKDINLEGAITFTKPIHFKLNGYTITYPNLYTITFEATNSIMDGRVPGSKLYCSIETATNPLSLVTMISGNIIGVTVELTIGIAQQTADALLCKEGASVIKDCDITITCSGGENGVYGIVSQNSAQTIINNTVIHGIAHNDAIINGIYSTKSSKATNIDNCAIDINVEQGYAYAIILQGAANKTINNTAITMNGENYAGYGILIQEVPVADILNTQIQLSSPYSELEGGGGIAIYSNKVNSLTINDTSAIVNAYTNKGLSTYLTETNAHINNCYTNAGHTGIQVNGLGNVYITNSTIGGYTHGLYCTHSPESHLFVNDTILRSKYNEDMPNCAFRAGYTCCCYIGLGERTGNTVHFDGCTFTSGNDEEAVNEAFVLRSNSKIPTTANLSNCIIDLKNPQPIRIEDGSNHNQLSAANIGVNVVDSDGNPITRAYVRDQKVETNIDSNPEHLHITNLLYRRLPVGAVVTGKDYETYYAYDNQKEVLNWTELDARVSALEENGGGTGNISSPTYTRLYDRVEITADDVTAAGEEGITYLTIGSNNIDLTKYNDLLLKIYIPISTNPADGMIRVYMTPTNGYSDADAGMLIGTQSTSISTACTVQPARNNIFAIQGTFTGDTFLYGQVMKNGYSSSYGYAGVQNAWTNIDARMKKSEKHYFHIEAYNRDNGFKFPAGTWVEVYGR